MDILSLPGDIINEIGHIISYSTKYVLRFVNKSLSVKCSSSKSFMFTEAVECGNVDLIRWAMNKGHGWQYGLCKAAIHHGHFEVLKLLSENRCYWGNLCMDEAARKDDIKSLNWCYENACPWFDESAEYYVHGSYNVNVIKWMVERKLKLSCKLWDDAVMFDNTDLIKWLELNNCPRC